MLPEIHCVDGTCVEVSSVMPQEAGAASIRPIFAGISVHAHATHFSISLAFHDGHYNIDLINERIEDDASSLAVDVVRPVIIALLSAYASSQDVKIIGAGIDDVSLESVPLLPDVLWFDLDIVPVLATIKGASISERADSASRKCAMHFGRDDVPRLSIGYRNEVEVDHGGCIRLVSSLDHYRATVTDKTWARLMSLADRIRTDSIKICFFNSTPQGGGVALMRHAMVRFMKLLGLRVHWFVPKPNPAVFRITKDNHNILQGVASPGVDFTDAKRKAYEQWVDSNCRRYWMDGPFQDANVIILDDPQVAAFVPYIKEANPKAKIIYRSHIEIRADLVAIADTPQQRVWNYLNHHIAQADMFVSHPIANFIPASIPHEKVRLMPASTDPIDGLNKPLSDTDIRFYLDQFNRLCTDQMGTKLQYPQRPYLIQIARFDPSKGIKDVLEVYRRLRAQMDASSSLRSIPQLVLCGHGSVDDPDGSVVFRDVMETLNGSRFDSIRHDVCVARLPPVDQLLNALLRCAHLSFQLSHREVKVTEALHKGVPVIAYAAGGIPLQFKDGEGGYLVSVGDIETAVDWALKLCTDAELHGRMKEQARNAITENYWTVKNCEHWLSNVAELMQLTDARKNQ